MTIQIAVRLPEDLVAWIDEQVAAGGGSRAAVTAKALRRYKRQVLAERDAEIYRRTGEDPEITEWIGTGRSFPELD